ncbi:hypothetical protein FRC12_015790 [Ceratobasidium sp. 428]|nr:hypothetical protein FRC12_015790 [Ceratobasidium sp. 428]
MHEAIARLYLSREEEGEETKKRPTAPSTSTLPPRAGSSTLREFPSVLDTRAPRPADPKGLSVTASTPSYGTCTFCHPMGSYED